MELVGLSVMLTLWLLAVVPVARTVSVVADSSSDAQLKLLESAGSGGKFLAAVDTADLFDDSSDNDPIDQDDTIGPVSEDSGLTICPLACFEPLPDYPGLLHAWEDSPLHSPRAPPALVKLL